MMVRMSEQRTRARKREVNEYVGPAMDEVELVLIPDRSGTPLGLGRLNDDSRKRSNALT